MASSYSQMSERQRTEEALKEGEERFRLTFENAPVGIAVVGLDLRIQQANPSLCHLLDLTQSELLQHTFLDLVHPDEVERALKLAQQLVRGELENYQSEERYITKAGAIIWGKLSATLVRDSQGAASYTLSMLEDITEHRQIVDVLTRAQEEADKHIAEQTRRLAQSSPASTRVLSKQQTDAVAQQRDQLLLATFRSLSSHVVVLDREGTITYASKSWEQFSDDSQTQLMNVRAGLNYLEVCRRAIEENDLFTRETLDSIRAVMVGNLPGFTLEFPSHSQTDHRWFLMKVDPMPRDHGGVVISYTDITGRKQAEDSLHNLLLEVERLKDQLQAENVYLREEVRLAHEFGEIIGQSELFKMALRQAEQVAPTDTTVLLTGETGTGKELLAHAIHNLSSRKERPLVKVNCATLPASLVESELFGHQKGAFTGAATARSGRFELANRATIFLDEIGELPLELQSKLLRVLQEGEFERLGSNQSIKVDVRVIAATNRELEEAVREGGFRADLYYRLNVFPIRMPSLRERREDIGMLVRFFVKQINQKLGKRVEAIPEEAMEAMEQYGWPGNVRELKNVIERAVIITQGGKLRLLESLRVNQAVELSVETEGQAAGERTETEVRGSRLKEVERDHILQVLAQTYWRVEGPQGAAAILGMNPSTLRTRMKKLGIRRPQISN